MLSSKVYEVLRWVVVLVLPAISVLITNLGKTWGWGLPYEAISATIDYIALFLGTIFGISKIVNDKKEVKIKQKGGILTHGRICKCATLNIR